MASAKASNFSIDHIMGFLSKEERASTSTAKANISSWTDSVGDLCCMPETYCNRYTVSQKLATHPHPYLWETPYHSMLHDCRNDHFWYAPFNYYPLDFCQGRFQNGAGPQTPYVGSYPPTVNNPRKRNRMRTVFTETQAQELELLFGVSDYPAAEAREELAVKAGLSAETVRVWFKNRRARRRRQGIIAKGRAHAKGEKRGATGEQQVDIALK